MNVFGAPAKGYLLIFYGYIEPKKGRRKNIKKENERRVKAATPFHGKFTVNPERISARIVNPEFKLFLRMTMQYGQKKSHLTGKERPYDPGAP